MCKVKMISFVKIAKALINKSNLPTIPATVIETENIKNATQFKRRGLNPVEYRNKLTANKTGVVQRNSNASKGG